MEQRRQPTGIPAGGQYAPEYRGESQARLDNLQSQGSFRYPPPLLTVEDTIDFWRACPVSDEVLDHLRASCHETQKQRYNAQMAQWDAANPEPQIPGPSHDEWEEARAVHRTQIRDMYPQPSVGDLRDLARLRQMDVHSRTMLTKHEREDLDSHLFVLPVSGMEGTMNELLYSNGADTAELDNLSRPEDVWGKRFTEEIAHLRSVIANNHYDAGY